MLHVQSKFFEDQLFGKQYEALKLNGTEPWLYHSDFFFLIKSMLFLIPLLQ